MIQVLGVLGSVVSQWLTNKQKETQVKHEAKVKQIEQHGVAETSLIAQMADSWKDEYWTVLLSLPIWAIAYGAITRDALVIQGVYDAMNALEAMPVWYQGMLGVAVFTSFGVKVKNYLFSSQGTKD